VIDAGYYTHDESGNEVKNPPGTRLVSRYFRGSFVIFAKGSPYNIGLSARYDAYNAQHDKMTAAKFRDFITKIIAELAAKQIEVEPDRL
jgi:serine/threonine-protein kinase